MFAILLGIGLENLRVIFVRTVVDGTIANDSRVKGCENRILDGNGWGNYNLRHWVAVGDLEQSQQIKSHLDNHKRSTVTLLATSCRNYTNDTF